MAASAAKILGGWRCGAGPGSGRPRPREGNNEDRREGDIGGSAAAFQPWTEVHGMWGCSRLSSNGWVKRARLEPSSSKNRGAGGSDENAGARSPAGRPRELDPCEGRRAARVWVDPNGARPERVAATLQPRSRDLPLQARSAQGADEAAASPRITRSDSRRAESGKALHEAQVRLAQIFSLDSMMTDWGWDQPTALEILAEAVRGYEGIDAETRCRLARGLERCARRGKRWDQQTLGLGHKDAKVFVPAYVEEVLRDVVALEPGEWLLLPAGWNAAVTPGSVGHAMLFSVERIDAGNFKLSVFNTGIGIDRHEHQARAAEELEDARARATRTDPPTRRFSTAFVVSEISLEDMSGAKGRERLSELIHILIHTPRRPHQNAATQIYRACSSLGRREKLDYQAPNWAFQLEQSIGNCCWKSAMAFVRRILTPEAYYGLKAFIWDSTLDQFAASAPALVEEARRARLGAEGSFPCTQAARALIEAIRLRGPKTKLAAIPDQKSPLKTLTAMHAALGTTWNRLVALPEVAPLLKRFEAFGAVEVWVSQDAAPDGDVGKGAAQFLERASRKRDDRRRRRTEDEQFFSLGFPREIWRRDPNRYRALAASSEPTAG